MRDPSDRPASAPVRSGALNYHAHWQLDLLRPDGARCTGRADLRCRFTGFGLARGGPVEAAVTGQVTLDGETAQVTAGRCLLRRVGGLSRLRIDLPLEGLHLAGSDGPLTLHAWSEGGVQGQPSHGHDIGHLILATADGDALATGLAALHLREFLEQIARTPTPSPDTLRMFRAVELR